MTGQTAGRYKKFDTVMLKPVGEEAEPVVVKLASDGKMDGSEIYYLIKLKPWDNPEDEGWEIGDDCIIETEILKRA